jgi:hypothetical protein
VPHLVVEVARRAVERRLHAMPIETDASGAPLDILAPPFPVRRTIPTALGMVRTQLIVRTVVLQNVVGTAQSSLALSFDECSVEFLSSGLAESLLGGAITLPFALRFDAATVPAGGQIAQLVADFTGSAATFRLDAASKTRLVAKVGQQLADLAGSSGCCRAFGAIR